MSITKEEILALPLINYQGDIKVISSKEQWLEAYESIKNETVLGFDTETKPNFVKGQANNPAIMQLATADCVYVIQFYKLRLLPTMIELLENKDVIKVGVAISDDMRVLQRRGKFKADGHLDLAHLAKKKGYTEGGLRSLCAVLMHGRLSKGMQCSNWERIQLSPSQILYAATDAWISREIYLKLIAS